MAWLPIHESSPQCLRDVRPVLSGLGRAARKVAPFAALKWAFEQCASRSSLETAIQEFVEQCGSAADALGRVRALLKAGLRNIRVQDEVGRNYSFTEIEELADDEADGLRLSPPEGI
jgi:hypothetical protein